MGNRKLKKDKHGYIILKPFHCTFKKCYSNNNGTCENFNVNMTCMGV